MKLPESTASPRVHERIALTLHPRAGGEERRVEGHGGAVRPKSGPLRLSGFEIAVRHQDHAFEALSKINRILVEDHGVIAE